MASIAVQMTANISALTQAFGKATELTEAFKAKVVQTGNIAQRAFAPAVAGLKSFAAGAGTVLTSLGRLSSVASSSAAILSRFTKGNEELQQRFESLTVTLAILAPALAALGPAIAFLTGPIGLVAAAIGGAILVFVKWEAVSTAVVNAAAAVWAKLAEFLMNLWQGIGAAAIGLGQILLGALTLDTAAIQAGYAQMIAGFEQVKTTMVAAAQGIAAGVGSVVTRLGEMVTKTQEARTEAERLLEVQLAGISRMLDAERQAQLQQQAIREAQREADAVRAAEEAAATAKRIADKEVEVERLLEVERERQVREQEIRAVDRALREQEEALKDEALAQAGQRGTAAIGILAGLFGKNKEFAIAESLISTFLAVDRALATFPPPFSFAVAAATLAFGLAQVAKIRATTLAEGGIVTAPTLAMVGEAGREAVIPLDRGLGDFGFRSMEQTIIVTLDERTISKAVASGLPSVVRILAGIRRV